MRCAGKLSLSFALLLSGLVANSPAADAGKTVASPDFQEVYDLVRSNLTGVNAADLNRTAVEALVSALGPTVSLLDSNGVDTVGAPSGPLVTSSNLFDGSIAYLRVGRVEEGLPDAVRQTCAALKTNKLSGVVLDLRFSRGRDYDAAANTAALFLKTAKPLLNWGKGVVQSKEQVDAISVPVVVLVNRETARASEALAAVLRETGVALLIGARTAGEAMIAREFPLKNGQILRIATAPVQVGEGTALTSQGVKPDVAVEVSAADERAWFADPFKQLRPSGATNSANPALGAVDSTNRTRRPRFNEADLVRERREGLAPDLEPAAVAEDEPEKPIVRDPALARALDLLKGLAVVRPSRP